MDIWGLVTTTLYFKKLVETKRHKALKFFPWRTKKFTYFCFESRSTLIRKSKISKIGNRRFFKINANASFWRNLRLIRVRNYVLAILNLKLAKISYFLKLLKFSKLCIFNLIHKELLFFLPLNLLNFFLMNFIKIWNKFIKRFIYKLKFINKYKKTFFYKISRYFFNSYINIHQPYESKKLQNLFEFFFYLSKKYKEKRFQKYQRYVYRIDIIEPMKKIKKKPYHYISLRLVRLYYLIYHYRQFNRLAKRIRKLDGLFEHNFCIALEGRLITALYRTGLVAHIFECIDIVNAGYFLINQSVIGHIHSTVRFGDLMGFAYEYKWLLYYRLLWRIMRKSIILNPPKYLFVSYSLLLAYMLRLPYESDLVFPSSVDMFRATGYFR